MTYEDLHFPGTRALSSSFFVQYIADIVQGRMRVQEQSRGVAPTHGILGSSPVGNRKNNVGASTKRMMDLGQSQYLGACTILGLPDSDHHPLTRASN